MELHAQCTARRVHETNCFEFNAPLAKYSSVVSIGRGERESLLVYLAHTSGCSEAERTREWLVVSSLVRPVRGIARR